MHRDVENCCKSSAGPEMFCKISVFAMSSLTFMASVSLSWVRLSKSTADAEQPQAGANHSRRILHSLRNHLGFRRALVRGANNTTAFIDRLHKALALLASKTKGKNSPRSSS